MDHALENRIILKSVFFTILTLLVGFILISWLGGKMHGKPPVVEPITNPIEGQLQTKPQ